MTLNDALKEYCLRIADNSSILAHRLSEWSGHGPILEEDIAMSNMALDLIGQARGFYSYAATLEGKGRTEDDLAFRRDAREFVNRNLVEQPDNKDFGTAMLRSFLYSCLSYLQFRALMNSKDETISGLSAKAIKEVTYHVRHCGDWVVRLGDGTEESHRRISNSVEDLWMYTTELFEQNEVDALLVKEGVAVDLNTLKQDWLNLVDEIFSQAKLTKPAEGGYQSSGGINGMHTEHLGYILAEMQFLPRAYPDAIW
jgi:ring-1,2-phenylacetyl-CoA epoxidase subunit PaaC